METIPQSTLTFGITGRGLDTHGWLRSHPPCIENETCWEYEQVMWIQGYNDRTPV